MKRSEIEIECDLITALAALTIAWFLWELIIVGLLILVTVDTFRRL